MSTVELTPNQLKWVEALESGKYAQGRGFLHNTSRDGTPDRFCCLGVACKLAILDGVPVTATKSFSGTVSYDGEAAYLPPQVADWLGVWGINVQVGHRNSVGYCDTASSLNDGLGISFKEIAQRVRVYGIANQS